MANLAEFDIGPLTWVKGEIDQALTRSLAALRAYAANSADAAQLRYAQTHFHQAHGALQIVGLDGVAKVCDEIEGLLVDLGREMRQSALAATERGFAAVSTYLEQLLAGEPNQPLKLFANYRELLLERGKPEPDPVDLYYPDLTGRAPKRPEGAPTFDPAHRKQVLHDEQVRFQRGLLRWLRKDLSGVRDMALATAALEAVEPAPATRAFWWSTQALMEGVAGGHIISDPALPRLANRIERQMKRLSDGSDTVAERLVQSQSTNAILTTFNEVNMAPVMDLRNKYKDKFEKEHGVKLGFMSFFVKAAVAALKKYPVLNASIDGNDIVYHGYFDIGIAVGSPRGLVVPILRDADQLSLAEIEKKIAEFGAKAKDGKLSIEELTGGTFSISNGGVFGSMLSTPIINPPQSAILGIHATKDRAVVENGQIVIRPMNYLAMSYDHRIIDGREAVLGLVTMKEALEDPARLLLEI